MNFGEDGYRRTRIVFAATQNKGGDHERMFVMVKNNLGPNLGGFGYSIVGAPLMERPDIIASRIVWGERLDGSALDLLAEAEDDGKGAAGAAGAVAARPDAQAFLKEALVSGERRQTDVAAEGAAVGLSWGRLFRASTAIGVVKRKEGFTGGWLWKLP